VSTILCLSLHLCQTPVTVRSIGPKGLSVNTLDPDKSSAIPTVTDNLFEQGQISENLVALSFQPMDSAPIKNGEMTFGDTDPSKYTGNITYL
jgi:cathepsin E